VTRGLGFIGFLLFFTAALALVWSVRTAAFGRPRVRRLRVASIALLGISALNYICFTNFSPNIWGIGLREQDQNSRLPVPGALPFDVRGRRDPAGGPEAFLPYIQETPSVIHRGYAFIEPDARPDMQRLNFPLTPTTMLYRTQRYQSFLSSGIPPETFRKVFGADLDIVRFVTAYIEAGDSAAALQETARIGPAAIDSTVVLERANGPLRIPASVKPAPAATHSSIATRMHSPNTFHITVTSDSGGWLVFSQNFDSAWNATVNGVKAEVVPAYGSTMAVPVEAGESEIVFAYRPRLYLFALICRVLFLAGFLALAIWRLRRKGFATIRRISARKA
jgi:Bacterial membrane protein YfhO